MKPEEARTTHIRLALDGTGVQSTIPLGRDDVMARIKTAMKNGTLLELPVIVPNDQRDKVLENILLIDPKRIMVVDLYVPNESPISIVPGIKLN